MLYVKFHGDIPVDTSYDPPKEKLVTYKTNDGDHSYMTIDHEVWKNRVDWNSFAQVTRICRLLEATTGKKYLPVDEGDHVSPRYSIIEPWKVGDKVSYAFNGDYYPDGEIVKITKTYQITTSTGKKYLRRRNTSRWAMVGGTWSLVEGHISKWNPEF